VTDGPTADPGGGAASRVSGRASDAERAAVVTRRQPAVGAGRPDLDGSGQRTAAPAVGATAEPTARR